MVSSYIFSVTKIYFNQYKQNRNVNIIIKIMIIMILMMIVTIIVIILAIMIMIIKTIIIAAVILNTPFHPGDFSTETTTVIFHSNKSFPFLFCLFGYYNQRVFRKYDNVQYQKSSKTGRSILFSLEELKVDENFPVNIRTILPYQKNFLRLSANDRI